MALYYNERYSEVFCQFNIIVFGNTPAENNGTSLIRVKFNLNHRLNSSREWLGIINKLSGLEERVSIFELLHRQDLL